MTTRNTNVATLTSVALLAPLFFGLQGCHHNQCKGMRKFHTHDSFNKADGPGGIQEIVWENIGKIDEYKDEKNGVTVRKGETAGQLHVGAKGTSSPYDWNPTVDGNELAVSGYEDFCFEFADGVLGVGFYWLDSSKHNRPVDPHGEDVFAKVQITLRDSEKKVLCRDVIQAQVLDAKLFWGVRTDEKRRIASMRVHEITSINSSGVAVGKRDEDEFIGRFWIITSSSSSP